MAYSAADHTAGRSFHESTGTEVVYRNALAQYEITSAHALAGELLITSALNSHANQEIIARFA